MIRIVVVVLALVITACGDRVPALSGGSPTGTAAAARFTPEPATPTAAPSQSPQHLPGSSVRVSVDGVDTQAATPAYLADDRPSTVVLAFPVAMDRTSVERWLPRSATASWSDDRTLSFSIAASEPNPAFKIPAAVSKDGATVIDILVLNLMHQPSLVISIFTVGELAAGARAPRAGAPRTGGGHGTAVDPSPDATKILVYGYPGAPLGPAPRVFDLATRASTPVPVPATSVPFFVSGWAGNDRVVLVGDHVWVSAIGGGAARAVADLSALGRLTGAAVSPDGTYVAIATADRLAVVDLATGTVRALAGHRDDCRPQAGPTGRLAWSSDERRIAVLECAATAPTVYRTRVIDVAADRTIANIDGAWDQGIAQLLTGEFAVSRDPGASGEGAPTLWVVFSFDGAERTRFLSRGPSLSPDGRYNIEPGCCAGEGFAVRDLAVPGQQERGTAGFGQWLRDGRILVVTR